ncbi:hypothetical protein WJX84_005862 [Apatococcus fuscideae]|uniref:Uncharacterized protein n=1 Tax=Apatococcus fuscideae TaxID=2026836 RepID=A0AAW1SZB1_9CHLO
MLSFETNNLLQAADKQIAVLEYSRAKLEKPWDGYCGLVKVGEEEYGAGATPANPPAPIAVSAQPPTSQSGSGS